MFILITTTWPLLPLPPQVPQLESADDTTPTHFPWASKRRKLVSATWSVLRSMIGCQTVSYITAASLQTRSTDYPTVLWVASWQYVAGSDVRPWCRPQLRESNWTNQRWTTPDFRLYRIQHAVDCVLDILLAFMYAGTIMGKRIYFEYVGLACDMLDTRHSIRGRYVCWFS